MAKPKNCNRRIRNRGRKKRTQKQSDAKQEAKGQEPVQNTGKEISSVSRCSKKKYTHTHKKHASTWFSNKSSLTVLCPAFLVTKNGQKKWDNPFRGDTMNSKAPSTEKELRPHR